MSSAPLLKVCGLMDSETGKQIADLPIDYIGFVLAPSKRRVTPEQAHAAMNAMAGSSARFVGVFVNPTLEELDDVLAVAPLHVLQMHGSESPAFIRSVRERYPGVSVWKALGVRGDAEISDASVAAQLSDYAGVVDAILLDAYDPTVGGGTGRTFRWEAIPVYAEWASRHGLRLFAAGGLHEDNVEQLLSEFSVSGVDVSSGVETDGRKDINKIRSFIGKVKPL